MLNHITVINGDKQSAVFGSDKRKITHFTTNATEIAYKELGGEFEFTTVKEKELELGIARKGNVKLFIFRQQHDTLGEMTHQEMLDVIY